MFGKLNKLISVLLLLAMAFNGTAVLAEEIITITQDGFEELFFEEEFPAEESEEMEIDFGGMTLEIEEEAEEPEIIEEEEGETDLAQIPMTLAEETIDGFQMDGTTLVKYTGTAKEVVVPDGVQTIASRAFEDCIAISSVKIPDSVTSIGWGAFHGCRSLVNVTLPSGLSKIESSFFYGCSSLTGIEIPAGVTEIGTSAFYGCSSLTGIEIPAGVTVIGFSTFSGCSSLTGIEIPAGVTEIEEYTFYGCSSLTGIEIPAGVTEIEEYTFSGCSSLSGIEIPAGVTKIGSGAFSGCSSLTGITIPEKVQLIEWGTFRECKALKIIELPEDLLFIDGSAFYGCSSLTGIEIPAGVTEIEEYTFYGCSSLTGIEIPAGVTEIGEGAFSHCSSLTGIEIPAGVTEIEEYTFYVCSSLTSIEIPVAVTTIGERAFYGCSALKEIYVPGSVTSIGQYAFENYDRHVVTVDIDSYAHEWCKANNVSWKCRVHTEVDDAAIAATCTTAGKTEGKHCSVCGTVTKKQEVVPAGHTVVIDARVEPTQQAPGLTEGKHCAACGEVLAAQEVIPALMRQVSLTKKGSNSGAKADLGEQILLVPVFAQENGWTVKSWKSSSKKIGAVNSDGVFTAKAEGTVTITVTTTNKKTATIKIKVTDPKKPIKVKLDKTGTQKLNIGETLTLTPTLEPAGAEAKYSWKTSSKKIATVKDGVITPVGEGTATITVTAARGKVKKTATMKVKVTDPKKPTKVSLDLKGTQKLNLGETLQLNATLTPGTAEAKLSWKTSSKKIAKVENGLVTPVAEGTATITVTATYGKVKKTASVKVKVVDPLKLTKVSLDKTGTQTLAKGETLNLTPTLNPEGTTATIKWKSSNKKVASVVNGVVTAKKKGKAVITVTAVRGKVTKTAKVTIQVK